MQATIHGVTKSRARLSDFTSLSYWAWCFLTMLPSMDVGFLFFFLATLGFCCFVWAFSNCSEWGLLSVEVHKFLVAMASLVEQRIGSWASVVAALGLSSWG